nr:MAG TPA: hypothetical protein [Crassvirales sp.]
MLRFLHTQAAFAPFLHTQQFLGMLLHKPLI